MNKKITISVVELENRINELKTMRDTWNADEVTRKSKIPTTSGGGKCVNELENIIKVYDNIGTELFLLLDSTISFMEKTKNSMAQSDQEAAKSILE